MNPYLFIYFLLLVCVSLFFSHLLNFPHYFSKINFIIPIFFRRTKLFSKTHALHRGSCLCFLSSLFILCSLECVFFFSSSLDISCVCFLSTLWFLCQYVTKMGREFEKFRNYFYFYFLKKSLLFFNCFYLGVGEEIVLKGGEKISFWCI